MIDCTLHINLFTKPYLCYTLGDALLVAIMFGAALGAWLAFKALMRTYQIGTDDEVTYVEEEK